MVVIGVPGANDAPIHGNISLASVSTDGGLGHQLLCESHHLRLAEKQPEQDVELQRRPAGREVQATMPA